MLNFFQRIKLFFLNCNGLFGLGIIENILIIAVFCFMLFGLMLAPSFLIAMAVILLFIWAMVF